MKHFPNIQFEKPIKFFCLTIHCNCWISQANSNFREISAQRDTLFEQTWSDLWWWG